MLADHPCGAFDPPALWLTFKAGYSDEQRAKTRPPTLRLHQIVNHALSFKERVRRRLRRALSGRLRFQSSDLVLK